MKRFTEKNYYTGTGGYVVTSKMAWMWNSYDMNVCGGEHINHLAEIENILGEEYDLNRLKRLIDADKNGRLVELPCKPGDDLYWYNEEENKVECQKQGVKGVIVLHDGFSVLDCDNVVFPLGTQWTCLTEQECAEKYGKKQYEQYFMRKFEVVK